MIKITWNQRKLVVVAIWILSVLRTARGLECYVCTRQDDNAAKCLTTTKTCESYENACYSEVRWGGTPYWSQGAEKQYYVTKRCARKEECEKNVNRFMSHCHRIWYEDWKCAECCQGDRCNYYIIMGAGNLKINLPLLMSTMATAVLYLFVNRYLGH